MSITLLELQDEAEHQAGASLDPRLDTVRIVNEGGRTLYACSDWQFRRKPPAALNFVANQPYVDMPADFGAGELDSVSSANTSAHTVEQTTLDELEYLRGLGSAAAGIGRFYVALSFPSQTTVSDAQPLPRLEIYPTPAANQTGALNVTYRSGWVELSDPTDVANVPPLFEGLLRRIVRATAVRYVEDDGGQALDQVYASADFQRIRKADAASMVNSQPMYGGQLYRRHLLVRNYPRGVAQPT